jgi:ParB family transcriptional regulator, chromosome partitioning protein
MIVPISEIQIGKRLRQLRESTVTELMESISRIGLRTPITVDSRPAKREGGGMDIVVFDLVAGHHRLEACRRLGWTEIEVDNVSMNGDERALWEIDENLCRADLTELERGEHLTRRKDVYEALHPQTKHGANRQPSGQFSHTEVARFSEDTASKIGIDDSTIRKSIRRVAKIDEKVRDRIRDNPEIANSGVELDALASLDRRQQDKAVSLVESGKAAGIRDAKRQIAPKPPSKEAQIRALREQGVEPQERPADPLISKAGAAYYAEQSARVAPDLPALEQVLRELRRDPALLANLSLERRVAFARTCLAWLNLTVDDLRGGNEP